MPVTRSVTAAVSSEAIVSARRLLWTVALLVGAGAAIGLLVVRPSSQASTASAPAAIWAAGARPAPAFTLRDQNGKPVSLAAYRGRAVLVTFIDPLCRDYCPLEAAQLDDAVAGLPDASRPAIVAVSASPYGNARANLLQDVRKWHLGSDWRWAVGTRAELERVWKAYDVAVLVTTKTVAGVRVHEVTHTEGAYLIDGNGHERALFLWPYKAQSVVRALRGLS
jgi:protein SCO1